MDKTSIFYSEEVLNQLHFLTNHLDYENISNDFIPEWSKPFIEEKKIKVEKEEVMDESEELSETKLNELLNLHMDPSEDVIYYLSDSDEECQIVKVEAPMNKDLEPELMRYVSHHHAVKTEVNDSLDKKLKSDPLMCENYHHTLKTEDDEIHDMVSRYRVMTNTQNKNDYVKTEISEDIYSNPTPGCSFHDLDVEKVQSDVYSNPKPGCSHYPDTGQVLVQSDIYSNPKPGCSHYPDAGQVLVQSDIYSNPKPGCSHYPDAGQVLVQNDIYSNPKPGCSHYPDAGQVLVQSDIYSNPKPGCSHYPDAGQVLEGPTIVKTEEIPSDPQFEESDEVSIEATIKHDPDLDIVNCPCSDNENAEKETNYSSDTFMVPMPIQNTLKFENVDGDDFDLEMPVGPTENVPMPIQNTLNFENVDGDNFDLEMPVDPTENDDYSDMCIEETSEENGVNNKIFNSKVERSIYEESLNNLTLFYCRINGILNIPANVSHQDYIDFCSKILRINSNHTSLVNEIVGDNLIKFHKLVIWGKNLNREIEDLVNAIPHGNTSHEAKKFVTRIITSQVRYQQHLVDNNVDNVYSDANDYKYTCLACARRDDNLTWLIAHICRDTTEIMYTCCFCGHKVFTNSCSLIYHVILDKVDGRKNNICMECCNNYPSLSNHLMDTQGSWKMRCNSCNFISLSQCSYYIHQRYHEKERNFMCPECGSYFNSFKELESHLKSVCFFDEKKILYICPICALIFKDNEILYQHLHAFHHKRMLKCIQCHTLFANKFQYVDHRAAEHPHTACSYQISHTCALCPGLEFKSSVIHLHSKNHANDVLNVIILYICSSCNFYTIHKQKFLDHKTSTCNSTPNYGKWDNAHEMKICGSCHDVKFVNTSRPFVCEYCEVSTNSNSVLKKAYECKVCKFFIPYNWDAVIQHFFTYHTTILVRNYSNCVKITEIPENCVWIPVSSPKRLPNRPNVRAQQPVTSNPSCPLYVLNTNSISSNNPPNVLIKKIPIPKLQSIPKRQVKQPTKRKSQLANTKFYNSLSHFMAVKSVTPKNEAKKQSPKIDAVINNNTVQLLRPCSKGNSMKQLVVSEGIIPKQVNNAPAGTYIPSITSTMNPERTQTNPIETDNDVQVPSISIGNLQYKGNGLTRQISSQDTLKPIENSDQNNDCLKGTIAAKSTFQDVIYIKQESNTTSETTNNHESEDEKIHNHIYENISNDTVKENVKKLGLKCKKCDFNCEEKLKLVKHFVDVHYIKNTYQCMECGDCFNNLKFKVNHLRSTHKIDTKHYLEPDVNRLDARKSKFRCPVCLRGFSTEQDKKLHIRVHGMAYLEFVKSNK